MRYIYAGLLTFFVVHVGDASDSRCPQTLNTNILLGLSNGISYKPNPDISLSLSKKSQTKQIHQEYSSKLKKQIEGNKSVGKLDKKTNNETSVCHYTLEKTKTEKTYQKILSKFRKKGNDITEIMLDLTPNKQTRKNVTAPPLPPKKPIPSKYCPKTLSYENLKALSGGETVNIQGRSLRLPNKGASEGKLDKVVPNTGATLFKDEMMSPNEDACTYDITAEKDLITPGGKKRVIILSNTNVSLPQTTSTPRPTSIGAPAA